MPQDVEVDTAERATEAADHLATRRYAVIIADCTLPGLSALDWLAALRGAAPTTPLVLQSGRIGPSEFAGYAVESGAVAVPAGRTAPLEYRPSPPDPPELPDRWLLVRHGPPSHRVSEAE